MTGEISVKLRDDGIVEVEGIKISIVALQKGLQNPPTDRLFSFSRDGDQLLVNSYFGAEAAAKFFAAEEKPEVPT